MLMWMMHRRTNGTAPLPLLSALVVLLSLWPCAAQGQSIAEGLTANVNPLIGTGGDPENGSMVFPGAAAPFGMVQLSPDTENHGFGYHYIHKAILGFSMTHMSGPGCANQGDVFFVPTTGPVVTQFMDFQ